MTRKTKRTLKKMMIGIVGIILLLALGIFIFMQQPMFGKQPAGDRLERIKNSPNYKNGTFKNISGADMTVGTGMKIRGIWKLFLIKQKMCALTKIYRW